MLARRVPVEGCLPSMLIAIAHCRISCIVKKKGTPTLVYYVSKLLGVFLVSSLLTPAMLTVSMAACVFSECGAIHCFCCEEAACARNVSPNEQRTKIN